MGMVIVNDRFLYVPVRDGGWQLHNIENFPRVKLDVGDDFDDDEEERIQEVLNRLMRAKPTT